MPYFDLTKEFLQHCHIYAMDKPSYAPSQIYDHVETMFKAKTLAMNMIAIDSNVEMSKAPYGPTELCQELIDNIDQKVSIYCDCQEVKDGIMIGNNSFI